MAFFNGWPWTQFQEQNLNWLINEQKDIEKRVEMLEQEEGDGYQPFYATADSIGLSEVDTGYNNSAAIQDFIDNAEEVYLYIPDGKIFNFQDPIVLTRDIKFLGSGVLRYNGPVDQAGYFITTYNTGTTYNTIRPQNGEYSYNIDCAGNIRGILFNQGIHNRIRANIRNAVKVGFNDNAAGYGYENVISVSIVNDTDAKYADAVGVYGNHPDNKYEQVFTRNCNIAFQALKQVYIDFIHAWIVGDDIYPGSACMKISGSGVNCSEIYCDTMQYPIYLDALPKKVKIGTIYPGFNDNAVSQATFLANMYRPWAASFSPTVNQTESVEIDTIYPLTAHGVTYNTLELIPLDKNITVMDAVDYKVKGNFRFIPATVGVYAGGSDLDDLPQGVSGYFGIRAYDEGQYYKVIELMNDTQSVPIYKIWYNKTNGRSIFFTVDKTYLTTVQYNE